VGFNLKKTDKMIYYTKHGSEKVVINPGNLEVLVYYEFVF
jgi:hypothetical protein